MAFPCACMRPNDQLYNAHTAKIWPSLSTTASKLTEIAKSQKNNMNQLIEWSLYIGPMWILVAIYLLIIDKDMRKSSFTLNRSFYKITWYVVLNSETKFQIFMCVTLLWGSKISSQRETTKGGYCYRFSPYCENCELVHEYYKTYPGCVGSGDRSFSVWSHTIPPTASPPKCWIHPGAHIDL